MPRAALVRFVSWQCLGWARRHGAKFEPTKYELIHFTRRPKKFDTKQKLRLGGTTREPNEAVKVLGLFLDPKLYIVESAQESHRG